MLIDRWGKAWRLSALLDGGDRLIDELLAITGRSDLASWVEVLRWRRRLGRARQLCAVGYTAAAMLLVAAIVFYLTGPTA